MKITELFISNWKSFPFTNSRDPIRFHDNLNIFIGPNSSGKTNTANALRLVCGYGPHPTWDPEMHKINSKDLITENYFNDINNPIEIKICTSGNQPDPIFINPSEIGSKFNYENQKEFFPIGETKVLYGLTTIKTDPIIFQKVWSELVVEAKEYFNIILPSDVPDPTSDLLFSDLFDKNGQIMYQAGSGIASTLYYMIELKIQSKIGVTCFLFEEPELHMHPLLLRNLTRYLIDLKDAQFFITTHSSLFIDEILRVGGYIFRFKKENENTKVTNVTSDKPKLRDLIFEELGSSPGDILLAKAVIWVEGPSDIIYIKHWLKIRGIKNESYSFMFYGGSLIKHISFDEIDTDQLITLCNLNPNSMIVIDRDRDSGDEKLKENAQKVLDNFTENQKFAWITGGREIENYINPDVLKVAVKKVHPNKNFEFKLGRYDQMINPRKFNKVEVAKEVVRIYEEGNMDDKFDSWDLNDMLTKLVEKIENAGNRR